MSLARRIEWLHGVSKLMIEAQGKSDRAVSPAGAGRALIRASRAALLDWDGCIAFDGEIDIFAARFIAEFEGKVAVVSNNSTQLPEDFVEHLRPFGIVLDPRKVILAGVEAIRRAVESGARRVLMVGTGRMRAFARSQGLELVRHDADLVLLLRDPRFSYARLERAANAVRLGARLIVANPDLTHPGKFGRLVPETGAQLAALKACIDLSATEMEIVGKPAAQLFLRACDALAVPPESAVMIGDNPATDIAGAQAAGLRSILIGPRAGIGFADLRSA